LNFEDLSKKIAKKLKGLPILWNAQDAVVLLSRASYSKWKQTEWLDFYFQYLCEKYLPRIVPLHKDVCGTTFFDGKRDLSPDFSQKGLKKNTTKKTTPNDVLEEFNHALNNYLHWRQMEWVEAYFNYLCERMLSDLIDITETVVFQNNFTAIMKIPFIFKAYIKNTGNQKIILSDATLITQMLANVPEIGVIIANGTIDYPLPKKEEKRLNHSVKNEKEKIENLEKELRQHSEFKLEKIHFIPISPDFFETCETFQPKDSKVEGHLREKIVIEIPKINDKAIYSIHFSDI